MKTLFLDLSMGAAGDMLTAALYELIDDKEEFINEINEAGIPGAQINAQGAVRCGICGTHMQVLINGCEESSEDAACEHHHGGHEHGHSHGHEEHGHCHAHEEHEHSHGHSDKEHEHCHAHEEHGHSHEHSHAGHHHSHHSMADIESIIDALNISDKVKGDVKAVYKIIAAAESKAHGMEVSEIHFHEVGTMDAVCDITAVCCLMEKLSPDKVIASPVCTGYGHVHASHGVIPVPAPATANILEDLPSYEGDIEAELCTPTGAALVKYFADEFGRMPVLSDKKTGYGMGTKEFEKCNALRAVLGDDLSGKENACAADISAAVPQPKENQGNIPAQIQKINDEVAELSFTVDDMTGEEIGFACERIFAAGALDVYTRPVFMKKNRPGTVIDVLVKEEEKGKIISAIFKHTTTLGIRQAVCERYILKRDTEVIETELGPVRIKHSEGYGTKNEKPEYEDLAAIAAQRDKSLFEIKKMLKENPGRIKD